MERFVGDVTGGADCFNPEGTGDTEALGTFRTGGSLATGMKVPSGWKVSLCSSVSPVFISSVFF
jgi:hypothetical protein